MAKAVSDAGDIVAAAAANDKPDGEQLDRNLSQSRTLADKLKADNLFSPPVKATHPVKSVLGIMGDEVLIEDTWYHAGDSIADAQITAVHPTYVVIRWQDNDKIFTPIDTPGDSSGSRTLGRRTTTNTVDADRQRDRAKEKDKGGKSKKDKDPAKVKVKEPKPLDPEALARKQAEKKLIEARERALERLKAQAVQRAVRAREEAIRAAEKMRTPARPKSP
jgi:hypothetical protein